LQNPTRPHLSPLLQGLPPADFDRRFAEEAMASITAPSPFDHFSPVVAAAAWGAGRVASHL